MWKDPIVEETRQLREHYASQFHHDVDAIFEDIQKRQAESHKKLVSFPPRKPTHAPDVA
jgi:hypothetical protein